MGVGVATGAPPHPLTHEATASEILDDRSAGAALTGGSVAPGLKGPQERGSTGVLETDRPVLRHRCTKHASSTAVSHHRYSQGHRNLDRIPPLPYPKMKRFILIVEDQ